MKPIGVYAMIVSVQVIIFAMIDHLNKKSFQRQPGQKAPIAPQSLFLGLASLFWQ